MGTQLPLLQRGTAPNFRPMSVVAKWSPISATAELLLNLKLTDLLISRMAFSSHSCILVRGAILADFFTVRSSVFVNKTGADTRIIVALRWGPMLFMVALWNRTDHYIFALWLLLSFFFFPRLMSAVADWMCAILPQNFRCRSESCCTRLAENTGRKKVAENCHQGTITQLCRAISSQLRHVSTIRKKLVKQQYVLHMSS